MKKFFYLLVLSALFVGCSSDGSREIQIDELEFSPDYSHQKIEDFEKVKTIFEVVPGKYEIAWKLIDDLPQMQNYSVSMKFKLRLKKSVDVKQEVFDEITNADKDNFYVPFDFGLLDANGKIYPAGSGIGTFYLWSNSLEKQRSEKKMSDKDKVLDFYRFLKSKPGTEIEMELFAIGVKSGATNVNCVDDVKNAKGLVCRMSKEDKRFEDSIGKILE